MPMKLLRTTAEDFKKKYDNPARIVYNSVEFCELNAHKADEIVYLDLRGSECSLGMIFGRKGNKIESPFSAPFGGFVAQGTAGFANISEALSQIADFARQNRWSVAITLPPSFYTPLSDATVFAASRAGFAVEPPDINYHINLRENDFERNLTRAGRKNLNAARRNGFSLEVAELHRQTASAAFDIIRTNREEHGYPLRMSFDDVHSTSRFVYVEFFIVRHDTEAVASAMVYRLSDKIAQVIYWGDIASHRSLRPMNFLAHALSCHYRDRGMEILDIGPASTDGVPNLGLCSFKESIGCISTLKHTVTLANHDD